MRVVLIIILGTGLAACSAGKPQLVRSHTQAGLELHYAGQPEHDKSARAQVVAQARAFLSGAPLEVEGYRFAQDPVGFVRAAYWSAGLELVDADLAQAPNTDGLQLVFRSAELRGALHEQQPRPADLVFFDAGHDATAAPAQVAVVESIDAHGTITALGWFAGGPRRIRLNLRDPSPGRNNDLLAGSERKPASALFRTFADPFRG